MNRAADRWLHPGAWWLWALSLAVAATRTTSPLLLGLIIAVCAVVVAARRPAAVWAGTFSVFVRMAALVVVIRVVFAVLFGTRIGTRTIVDLPGWSLPEWMAGVRLGGPVTVELIIFAAIQGAQLATLLICVGAANSLASPTRLLKSLPAGAYHVGVAAVVALALAPRIIINVRRIMAARRLRGLPSSGLRAATSSAMPVFEASLDDAISLAAAMDTRGYGRAATATVAAKRTQATLILAGVIGIGVGLYAVLDANGLGLALLATGVVLAVLGLYLSGRTVARTRYRPDPWLTPEWLTSLSGIVAATAVLMFAPSYLNLPLVWPTLPLAAATGVVFALLPAVVTPLPPGQS